MSRPPEDGMEHDAIQGTVKKLAVGQSEELLADALEPKSSTIAQISHHPSYFSKRQQRSP